MKPSTRSKLIQLLGYYVFVTHNGTRFKAFFSAIAGKWHSGSRTPTITGIFITNAGPKGLHKIPFSQITKLERVYYKRIS